MFENENNTGESSNGRIPDFDSGDVGSNPASPSITKKKRKSQKEWQKSYQKQRYEKDKAYRRERNEINVAKKREWFTNLVSQLSCEECGFSHPGALDFHHIDPTLKDRAISQMVYHKCSESKILKEISKCKVLCANCHRILHWKERN
jgi:hypothetical protein